MENVADVVETVTDVVGRKVVGGVDVDAEQIPYCVVVLVAVESPEGDAPRIVNDAA